VTQVEGYYGDRRHRPDWLVYIDSKNWQSLAYANVDVPDYYLPATLTDMPPDEVYDGITEKKAPYGTREQLAGAWYGWRESDFWTWRFPDE